MSEILYTSKDGIISLGHYQDRKHNYYWINVNDFQRSGNIQLDEKHFKLLKKWFKRKR